MRNKKRILSLLLSGTAKDTYVIFSGNILSSFLAFLYTIFLVRVFSPEKLGIFSSVTAFILLSSDILDLGISTSLSRFYPEIVKNKGSKKAENFINNTFKFKIIISLIYVFLIILVSPLLSGLFLSSDRFSFLYFLAGIGILSTASSAFSVAYLSAKKQFLPVSLISGFSTLVKLLLVLILFYANRFTLEMVVLSFALAPLVAFIFSLKFVKFSPPNFFLDFSLIKKLMSYSAFIGISRIFSAVSSRFDALMLIPLASAFEAGIYSAAYKIIFTYILLAGSFSMVIAPRLSAFSTLKEAAVYLKKIILGVILILFSMIIMYLVAPVFVPFVLGINYAPSVSVFRALLLPIALFVLSIPSVNFLLYVAKKPQISALNTFVQIFIIFLGNWFFIPVYGRFGPVFTLTLAYGYNLLSSVFFSFYYYKHG